MSKRIIFILSIVCIILVGCVGKNSILFVTKTSIAVDIDTNPPTFDVGYGRYEGSIAPVVKDGQVLPLLSSISADTGISSNVFGSGVAQNFGVGNAAIIMSQYLGSPSNPSENSRSGFNEIVASPAKVNGSVTTGRRYFFGTKTTVGFTTSFAAERGFTPDSISLGYKRKEFAYVPIRQNGSSGSETLAIPSMLATSGTSSTAGVNKAGFAVSQFYATGKAANFLAAHPTIRNSVISKIIGDDNVTRKLEKAEETEINKIDTIRLKAELVAMKAKNKIDSMPAQELDSALQSMKDAGIANSDDSFRDTNGDGTISEMEKRDRLKKIAQPFDDEDMINKISNWVANNG